MPTDASFSRVSPESCEHALARLALQVPYAPHTLGIGVGLLRCLDSVLPCDVSIDVDFGTGANIPKIEAVVEKWPSAVKRISIGCRPISNMYAQDAGKSGIDASGESVFLVPRGAGSTNYKRKSDPIVQSKMHWQGGNILADETNCLVGARSIATNMVGQKMSFHQVHEEFCKEMGMEITVLGDVEEAVESFRTEHMRPGISSDAGQGDFHLDMDISLLGRPRPGEKPAVAIADGYPDELLVDYILDCEDLFEGQFLELEEIKDLYVEGLGNTLAKRRPYLKEYEAKFLALGYQVLRIPDFRLSQHENMLGIHNLNFNYVNTLPTNTIEHGATVYLLQYGRKKLDENAFETYRKAGITTIAVNPNSPRLANQMMFFRGGLHCLAAKRA